MSTEQKQTLTNQITENEKIGKERPAYLMSLLPIPTFTGDHHTFCTVNCNVTLYLHEINTPVCSISLLSRREPG